MFKSKKLIATLMVVAMLLTLIPMVAFAAAPTVTAAAATSVPVSANTDLAGNIVIDEAAPGELTVGDIVITAPAGVTFNTSVTPDVAKTAGDVTLGAVSVTANTITIPVTAVSTATTKLTIGGVTKPQVYSTTLGSYNLSIAGAGIAATNCAPISVTAAAANPFSSNASVNKTSADADNIDEIELTVFVYDQFYNVAATNTPVYFASSRANTDTFAGATPSGQPGVFVANTDSNGKVVVKVRSSVAGNAKIGVALSDAASPQNVYQYLIGNSNTSTGLIELVKTFDVQFSGSTASQINQFDMKLRNRSDGQNFAPTLVAGVYQPTVDPTAGAVATVWGKANDLDYYELSVKVANANNAPVSGAEVKFSVDKANARFSEGTVTTDAQGIAKTKIYATKSGTYTITYSVTGATAGEAKVKFDPAGVSKIFLKTADNKVIAKGTRPTYKFEVQDSAGNQLVPSGTEIAAVDMITQPSGVSLKKSDFTFGVDANNNWVTMQPNSALNKEGEYKIRVSIANGSYADFSFTVKTQGTIVALKLSYPQSTLPLNTVSGTPTVTWVDAAGVEKDADSTRFNVEGITFSANDYNKVVMPAGIAAANGTFTTASNKDFIGDLIITATDNVNKLTASYTITVGRQLSTLVAVAPAAKTSTDKTAEVVIKAVDLDGKTVAVGGGAVTVTNAYAVNKPAGASVSVEEATGFAKALKEKGEAKFNVTSNVAGDVTCLAVINVAGNNYTVTFTVPFGTALPAAEKGAQSLVLQIGSKVGFQDGAVIDTGDFAPFIKAGTTFVPVRVLANAFNAEAAWDGATNTATITRADIKITLVAGDKNVKVEKDGVTTTIEASEALFINENNRLCAPMRAIADAFGATLDFGPKDGAVEWVSFTQAK